MKSESVTQEGAELAASPCSAVLMATPRTDGQIYWNALPQLATSAEIVYASFARGLERENAMLRDYATHKSTCWAEISNREEPCSCGLSDVVPNDKISHRS